MPVCNVASDWPRTFLYPMQVFLFSILLSRNTFISYVHTFYCFIINILHFKGGHFHERKESTADINQLLQHVETKFSDVLIPAQQIVTQEYLGKGMESSYIILLAMYFNFTM